MISIHLSVKQSLWEVSFKKIQREGGRKKSISTRVNQSVRPPRRLMQMSDHCERGNQCRGVGRYDLDLGITAEDHVWTGIVYTIMDTFLAQRETTLWQRWSTTTTTRALWNPVYLLKIDSWILYYIHIYGWRQRLECVYIDSEMSCFGIHVVCREIPFPCLENNKHTHTQRRYTARITKQYSAATIQTSIGHERFRFY